MIDKIYQRYKIPVLIVDEIENKSIVLRRDHIPVLPETGENIFFKMHKTKMRVIGGLKSGV